MLDRLPKLVDPDEFKAALTAALNAELNALDWENTPVAAASSEIGRGRVETRTLRVLPAPEGTGFAGAARAVLIRGSRNWADGHTACSVGGADGRGRHYEIAMGLSFVPVVLCSESLSTSAIVAAGKHPSILNL